MKRDKRDIVFSKLVRERANWTCERCGRYFPFGERSGLDCSHFFGRRYLRLRWHPDNAAAHCRGCHGFLSENPDEFMRWIEGHIGEGRIEMLRERRNDNRIKYTKRDKEEIHAHLKSELQRLESLRAEGKEGRLEFEAYD